MLPYSRDFVKAEQGEGAELAHRKRAGPALLKFMMSDETVVCRGGRRSAHHGRSTMNEWAGGLAGDARTEGQVLGRFPRS